MIPRYYENELRYLHEAGREYARAFPEQARYLDLDALAERDPSVERLFEGFALLAARVHERLDDDLPELTQRLVGLLYPQALRPMPGCCLVAFAPREGVVQQPVTLARGTAVHSAPVGPEKTRCTFTTAHAVRLNPVALDAAEARYASDGTSRLRLRFRLLRGARLGDLALDPLRIYLHADTATAATLHLFLTRHATRVELRTAEDTPIRTLRGTDAVTPGGFGPDEALLPDATASFSGVRLLQEYLLFRSRFWCVDLHGLTLSEEAQGDTFFVDIVFDRAYPENRRFSADTFRLHTTPAVNLFAHDAEPIRMDHTQAEWAIHPSLRHPTSIAPFDVEEVVGIEDMTGTRHEYRPLFGLDGRADRSDDRRRAAPRTYSVHRRFGPTGRQDLVLALSLPETTAEVVAAGKLPPSETLSVALRCTNGGLPHEALAAGALAELDPDAPQVATPINLDAPTLDRYPPLSDDRDLLWTLLAHWSFNHQSVATREALVGLLGLYDWTGSEAGRRRRRGIQRVTWRGAETLVRGAVRRGAEVVVRVEDGAFGEDGELALFGLVLSHFLAQYATINSFVHLTIESAPSGARMTWRPERGLRPPV